jgi:hypothetical protein
LKDPWKRELKLWKHHFSLLERCPVFLDPLSFSVYEKLLSRIDLRYLFFLDINGQNAFFKGISFGYFSHIKSGDIDSV